MKTLRQYILEHLKINEGGNAIESNPIPAVIAPKIYDEIENIVHSKFKDIEMAALGSIGKKKDEDTNGDIDIAIKIDSKGPVVFKQLRIGKNGKNYYMYKFRTMVPNAQNMGTGVYSFKDDPRITRVGKFLRKSDFHNSEVFLKYLDFGFNRSFQRRI